MYSVRLWASRHASLLHTVYQIWERCLRLFDPLLRRIGHERLDPAFSATEKVVKGFLFDSKSCGQCVLGETGLACPMNCPKTLRNGPCGGVREGGYCEVDPTMKCVWVMAWEGSRKLGERGKAIQVVQLPVDARLKGSSAWLRALRRRQAERADHDV